MSESSADRTKELVLLMTQHQRRVFSYIYTLVPDRHAAEDILQDLPIIYLHHPKFRYAATVKLSGFAPLPDGLIRPQGLRLQ